MTPMPRPALLALLAAAFLLPSCEKPASAAETSATAASETAHASWMTDWEAAKAESASTGKPILILLTGSDWCTWCIKLEKAVFETKTFADFADENLVLMMADFPRKTKLPEEVAKQNEALKKQYLADGYPTVWLLDAKGEKLSADLGEIGHDPDAWVAKLKELIAESRQPAQS